MNCITAGIYERGFFVYWPKICTLSFMDTEAKKFLFDLLSTPSPTGFEVAGQRVWAKYVKKYSDSVQNDAYGNTWATINEC